MTLKTYASGSGALSFVWEKEEPRPGGGYHRVAASEPVTEEQALTLLKPGYELFNEGTEKNPQWVQVAVVTRSKDFPGWLIMNYRGFREIEGSADSFGRRRFEIRDDSGEAHEVHNISMLSSLNYYLAHEEAIIAQRAAREVLTPTV